MTNHRCFGLRSALALALLVSIGSRSALAQTSGEGYSPAPIYDDQPIGKQPPPPEIEPITEVIPFWGKEVRADGVDLPLPFGLGLTYT